jgi:hypothetical protein
MEFTPPTQTQYNAFVGRQSTPTQRTDSILDALATITNPILLLNEQQTDPDLPIQARQTASIQLLKLLLQFCETQAQQTPIQINTLQLNTDMFPPELLEKINLQQHD